MRDPPATYLAPATATFAVLAVAFSAAGGLVGAGSYRTLLAGGASFWLLMLVVVAIFAHSIELSHLARACVFAIFGTLAGVCFSLCFALDGGWKALVGYAALGAVVGFFSYWAALLYRPNFWRDYFR